MVQKENRQQRWTETRNAFLDAARELSASHGFEAATMSEIASRAGKHLQTLYRHFPTKTALGSVLFQEEFLAALSRRDSDALVFWRDWVRRAITTRLSKANKGKSTGSAVRRQPASGRTGLPHEYSVEYVALLAGAVADDFGRDQDDLVPALVANMLWGANMHAIKVHGEEPLLNVATRMIDQTIEVSRRLLAEHPATAGSQGKRSKNKRPAS